MNCPQCQRPLREGKQFCTHCGTRTSHGRDSLSDSVPTVERGAEEAAGGNTGAETLAATDPLVGRVLDGKYELLSRLGEGGMGAVYRASRVHIGDEVAVKVLHSKLVTDETLIERFRREARAAAQLQHPNVVTIHDYGEARGPEGFAYIVMELVRGLSLRDLLRREGRLDPAHAVALMRDICAGVGAAHRREIVHRDIKPDNIIVLPANEEHERERIKVVDFGIAKLRDLTSDNALTQTGVMVGTPFYMSPEQCRGEHLDVRADVYSLGALLHEMLSGSPPFTAPSVSGVLAKHLTEPPPPLSRELYIAPALQAAISRALSKEPEGRQRDAAEFARELQAAAVASGEASTTGDMGQTAPTAPVFPATTHPATVMPTPLPPVHTPTHAPAPETHSRPAEQQTSAPGPQTYQPGPTPPPHANIPAPRKSRAPLVIGLIILLVIGGGVLAVVGLIYVGSRKPNARNLNAVARPSPKPTVSANNNGGKDTGGPPASTPMERAEQKILNGSTLTRNDLAALSPTELRILRNVVYARYGRTFQTSELQNYFAGRPWYKPRPDFNERMLTVSDRANADLIKAVESGSGGSDAAPAADAATVQREVGTVINGWAASTTARNLHEHIGFYADTLETFYLKQNVPSSQVAADRARAFTRYDDMEVYLNGVQITPDPTGTRAVAVFDKTWDFEADNKHSTGSVRQQLTLAKFGDRWLIVGEKDLEVHYQNSEEY
ncbi:MAG: protein kinase [Acidobacteria bacterium]|nr:protein kinase [Acidobacteriota bacterium]